MPSTCKGILEPFKIGNSRNLEVTIRNRITKVPIDITGDKFYFTVKDTPDQPDTAAVVQASVVAPADSNSAAGIAIIPVSTSDTTGVEPGNYFYDISWIKTVSAPGEKITIVEGKVGFSQPVTLAQS